MPYVHVRITREGNTPSQKKAVISGITQVLVDVLDKNPASTFVIIEEVDLDNWGIRGRSVRELRAEKGS